MPSCATRARRADQTTPAGPDGSAFPLKTGAVFLLGTNDYEAYQEVKRNLARLIAAGQLRLAMELSLEFMKQGSRQVEMSDEGMMTEDIEDCLSVVLQALRQCDLPPAEGLAWCSTMLANDRVGFIAKEPLQSLRNHFQVFAIE